MDKIEGTTPPKDTREEHVPTISETSVKFLAACMCELAYVREKKLRVIARKDFAVLGATKTLEQVENMLILVLQNEGVPASKFKAIVKEVQQDALRAELMNQQSQ